MDSTLLAGGIKQAEELDLEFIAGMEMKEIVDITKVAKLLGGKQLNEVLSVRFRFQLSGENSLILDCRGLNITRLHLMLI